MDKKVNNISTIQNATADRAVMIINTQLTYEMHVIPPVKIGSKDK